MAQQFAESMQVSIGLAVKLSQLAEADATAAVSRALAGLALLHERLGRLESSLATLGGAQETLTQNLDQLRLQTEPLACRLDELTADFVNRHVSEPLFKELGRLCWTLRILAGNDSLDLRAELHAQANALERLLDANDFQLIHPQAGEPFNPHHHQAVLRRTVEDVQAHSCIAQTVQPGLLTSERVVQHARVEVFVCSIPQPSTP